MHSFRLYLICAVWLAITVAAYANQRLFSASLSPGMLGAVSVLVWAVHALAAGVLFYALALPQASQRRFEVAMRLCCPLLVSVWCVVITIFVYRGQTRLFIPWLLMSTAFITLWWGDHPSTGWLAGGLCFALSLGSLFVPGMAVWAIAGMCPAYVLLALFTPVHRSMDNDLQ